MRKITKVLTLMICFALLFGTFTFAATGDATASGLLSRMTRLPGEPTYYDPDTGVYFQPATGRIENFTTQYAKLPGENKYYKKGYSLKYFDPMIYSQFTKAPTTSSSVVNETYNGFTIPISFAVEGGSAVGAGLAQTFYISYNATSKTWTLSEGQSVTGNPITVGTKLSAGIVIGYMTGNENAIKGTSVGGSVDTPIGQITITGNENSVTYSIGFTPGPSASYSQNITYSTAPVKLFTIRSFF